MTILGLHLSLTLLDLLLLNVLFAYSAYPLFSIARMNMAFVAFSGFGGYSAAILSHRYGVPTALCVACAVIFSALVALPLSAILGRVRGVYLAIVTINLAAVFQLLINNLSSLTGGASGMTGLPIVVTSALLGAVAAAVVAGFWLLSRSRRGLGLKLQRNDELLARSAGVNTSANVAALFVLSAAIAALQGALTAFWYGFVSPDTYSFQGAILAVAMVILGGVGQWLGPLIGAVFFTVVPEWMRPFGVWRDVATGIILLVVVLYLPEGLAGFAAARAGLRRARSSRESRLRAGAAMSSSARTG
jgi:branched-chain amino acid transport system permease protein